MVVKAQQFVRDDETGIAGRPEVQSIGSRHPSERTTDDTTDDGIYKR